MCYYGRWSSTFEFSNVILTTEQYDYLVSSETPVATLGVACQHQPPTTNQPHAHTDTHTDAHTNTDTTNHTDTDTDTDTHTHGRTHEHRHTQRQGHEHNHLRHGHAHTHTPPRTRTSTCPLMHAGTSIWRKRSCSGSSAPDDVVIRNCCGWGNSCGGDAVVAVAVTVEV